MSLPACQQRVLDTIENTLQRREPRLASMFAMFTRLTHGEGLPRTERLEATPWWAWHRRRRPGRAGRSPRARRSQGGPAAALSALIIPALIVLTISVFLGMSSSPATCAPAMSPHGLVTSHGYLRSCPSAEESQFLGHGR